VGGPEAWPLRRGIAFAAVVALHVGLVITLTFALRPPIRSSSTDFVSALISLPARPAPTTPEQRPQIPKTAAVLVPVEPITTPVPEIRLPNGEAAAVDWGEEARHAAAMTGAPKVREFGRTPKSDFEQESHPGPVHAAGEQYRDEYGDFIVWVSDRCYIVSAVPPLGLADVLVRSIPTRTVCQDDSGPRGDLFNDLQAYKKNHPQ